MTTIIRRLVNNQNVKANNEFPTIGSSEFLTALIKASIETVTLNGDIAYTTTGDYVLDFRRKVEALDEGFRILEAESISQDQ